MSQNRDVLGAAHLFVTRAQTARLTQEQYNGNGLMNDEMDGGSAPFTLRQPDEP